MSYQRFFHFGVVLVFAFGFSACMSKYSHKSRAIQTDVDVVSTEEAKAPSEQPRNNSFMSVPGWYASPPIDASYIYGVSSQISADLQVAINKAAASARVDIGRQVKVKIQAIQKRYTEDASTEEQSELSSLFTEVEKTIVNVSLSGSRVREQSFSKEGRNWRAYVLVEYPVADIEMSLTQQAQKSNNQSFLKKQFAETRKRASKAFQELDDAVSEKPAATPTVDPPAVVPSAPEVTESAKPTIQPEVDLSLTEEAPPVVLPPSDKTFDKEPVPIVIRESEKSSEKTKGKFASAKKAKRTGRSEDDFSFLEAQPKVTNSIYFGYYGSKRFNSTDAVSHYGYIGFEKSFSDNRFGFLTELYLGSSKGVTSTKDFSLMTLIGLRWNFVVTNNWQLGLTGKVGFNINFNVGSRVGSYNRYAYSNAENQSGDFASSVPVLENSRKGKKNGVNFYDSDGKAKTNDQSASTSSMYDDDYYYYYPYTSSSDSKAKEVGFVGQLGLSTKFHFTDKFYMLADIGYTYLAIFSIPNNSYYLRESTGIISSNNVYINFGFGFSF